jgi:hypothetical protein
LNQGGFNQGGFNQAIQNHINQQQGGMRRWLLSIIYTLNYCILLLLIYLIIVNKIDV